MRSIVARVNRISPAIRLSGIGLGMAAIWFAAFGGRYSLTEFGHLPMQSLATLNQNSLESAVLYIASFAVLFGLYWLAARTMKPYLRGGWMILVGGAVLMNATLLPMHPFDAADIYDYIIRGRMTASYGLNPMKDAPTAVPVGDSVYPFAAWHDATSAYGPAWEALAALTTKVVGEDRNTNVIAFKLLACLGYALTALFIGLTLRKVTPERVQVGLLLFAWNPLMVYFAGGTGHNDLIMAACVALSIYCIVRRQYIGAMAAAVLGGLVKFIPLLLLPIIVILIWQNQPPRARLQTYISGLILSMLFVLAFYAPFWTGIDTLAMGRRGRLFTSSTGTLVRQALTPFLGESSAGEVVGDIAVILFGMFYLWQLWAIIRSRRHEPLYSVRVLLRVLLFYLMVSAIWFQHWYLAWVIPLAALLEDTPVRRLTLLFSYLVTWQPLLYNYVTFRYDGWMPLPWRDLIPVSVFMGGAWLYVGGYWLSVWNRQRKLNALQSN